LLGKMCRSLKNTLAYSTLGIDYSSEIISTSGTRMTYSVQVRFYQASTSELYGKVVEVPQKETTPFYPR